MKGSKLYALQHQAFQIAYEEVTKHNKKANLDVKSFGELCYNFEKVHHLSLV